MCRQLFEKREFFSCNLEGKSVWYFIEKIQREREAHDMINFEEELEKYEPSLDIEQVSEVVNNSNNMTDVTDIMRELSAEVKGTM